MKCEFAIGLIGEQRYTFRALGVLAIVLVVLSAVGAASVETSPDPDSAIPGALFAGGWQLGLVAIVGLALCNCTEAIVAAIEARGGESRPQENGGEGERRPPVRR